MPKALISFVGVFLILCFSLSMPLMAAENELIPEKKTGSEVESSSNFSVDEVKDGAEEPAWGLTVLSVLLGGFLFMFLEIAIIPGFGAAGIIGIALLITGIALSFLKLSLNLALAATFGSMVGLILLIAWFFYVFPKTSMGKNFVLSGSSNVEDGCVAVRDLSKYLGKEGITQSMLRPSGVARIDGERIDVISDCEYVDNGTRVKVVKVKGGRLIVAPIEEESFSEKANESDKKEIPEEG